MFGPVSTTIWRESPSRSTSLGTNGARDSSSTTGCRDATSRIRGALPRDGDAPLQLLQLLGDKPLRAGEGLPAHPLGGHPVQVGAGNLERVAEDPVVPNPEVGDAGAGSLLRLQLPEDLLGPAGELPRLVH